MNPVLKDGACGCPSIVLRGPAFGGMTAAQPRNVHGCCGVGGASMPASDALETVPGSAVRPFHVETRRACLRRVFRVYRDQRYTFECSLVGQKSPQLGECPTVVRSALGPINRCPRADMRQFFDGNPASGVFGLPNDNLADPVVQIGSKPRLLPTPCAQQALGGFGSFLLEFSPKSRVAISEVGVVRAAKHFAVTVRRDISAAQVNPEVFGGIAGRNVTHIYHDEQKKFSVAVDKIGLPSNATEASGMVITSNPRDESPTIQSQDRHAIQPLPRQDALVIDDSAVRSERRLDRLVALVDLAHLGDGANGHLSRQTKVTANIGVGQFLKFDLVGALAGKRHAGKGVARRVEPLHRRQKRRGLFGGRQQTNLHGKVHLGMIAETLNGKQGCRLLPTALSLPGLKAGASRARIG